MRPRGKCAAWIQTAVAFVFGAMGAAAQAQEPLAEPGGLMATIRQALQYDARFAAARADFDVALEKRPQALSRLLPSVSASARYTDNQVDLSNGGSAATRRFDFITRVSELSLSQPIFNIALFAELARADEEVAAAGHLLEAARQDLYHRTAKTYFDLLLARDSVALVREQGRAIAEQLEQARKQYAAGFGTVTDVNEAQARFDLNGADLVSARNQLRLQIEALRRLTGEIPRQLRHADDTFAAPEIASGRVDEWTERALSENPNVTSRSRQAQAAREAARAASAGHLPTLELFASASREQNASYTTLDASTDNTRIGIQLRIPLYQGGSLSSRERESVARIRRAEADLEEARRAAEAAARESYQNLEAGRVRLDALQQAVRSGDIAVISTQKSFQAGLKTNAEVLDAQQRAFQNRREQSRSRYEYLANYLGLQVAVGTSDLDDHVQRVDRILVPLVSAHELAAR